MTEKEQFEKRELLRKQFEKQVIPKYGNELWDWEKAILIINECHGHGEYIDTVYGNINYVKWLENKIING